MIIIIIGKHYSTNILSYTASVTRAASYKDDKSCMGYCIIMTLYSNFTLRSWVSEQFLNGTSAQYRLCSAILLKLHKS